MTRIITFVLLTLLSFTTSKMVSQNKNAVPCSSKEYKQFDFWVGNWNVYNTKNQLIGTNNIVKVPNACAIQENWESKAGSSTGTSYNYYNSTDKSWNQLWIDNSGYSLVLKGNYSTNEMILKSSLIKSKKGDYYNQITWSKNTDGTVTQVWDLVNEKNVILKELFRGIYKKNIK